MMPYANAIRSDKMPRPDTTVLYADNMFGPAMFHYAPEDTDFTGDEFPLDAA